MLGRAPFMETQIKKGTGRRRYELAGCVGLRGEDDDATGYSRRDSAVRCGRASRRGLALRGGITARTTALRGGLHGEDDGLLGRRPLSPCTVGFICEGTEREEDRASAAAAMEHRLVGPLFFVSEEEPRHLLPRKREN